MGQTRPTFGGIVLASLAGVVGTKYLLGGALAMVAGSVTGTMLVADSVALSAASGVLLAVVTGGFADGAAWARYAGLAVFLVVAGLGVPAVTAGDLVVTAETAALLLGAGYLLVRSPIERPAEPDVEAADSASRVGSTLR